MKVLALTRYNRHGASSRIRTMQYLPFLEDHGLSITVSPLLDDEYLLGVYRGKRVSPLKLFKDYSRRLIQVLRAGRFNLVWIEKELFPMLPAVAERYLELRKIPFVVDYDDASFHNYDLNKNTVVRKFLGNKIDSVMRTASAVVAGNDYLAARAAAAGARRVEIVPSVVNLENYHLNPSPTSQDFVIGWIGTPMTAKYLQEVAGALREVSSDSGVIVRLVGAGPTTLEGVRLDVREWQEADEADDVSTFDVGIMPLPDSAWENGKCGYKLIQYMACGKPVVASPVGANKKIVKHLVNGFLASSMDEWLEALRELRSKPELRATMGEAARITVETDYCLAVTAPKLLNLLKSVAR